MPVLLVVGPAAALFLIGLTTLIVGVPDVRDDLRTTKSALTKAQDDLGRGDVAAARFNVRRAGTAAGHARRSTNGWVWDLYAHVPVVQSSVQEMRAVAEAADDTTQRVLPALLRIDPGPVRWNGRVDSRPLAAAARPLAAAEEALSAIRRELRAAPHARIGVLADARVELDDALTRLSRLLTEARVVARTLPALTSGTKRYLLAVQNNAEQRATGGLLGAYALLRVDDGAVRLEQVGPNQDLRDPGAPVVALGPEYDARYGRFETTRTWRSANLSPDTPTVGRLLAALWKRQQGSSVDGVVLVDPVALARLLGATGPVRLSDGMRLTEANAVRVLLVDAYRRFPRKQDAARNAYLQDAARTVVGALARGGFDGRRLMQRVAAAAASGHLQVWSADAAVEAELRQSRVGGVLATDEPFLEVVTQDVGGSKLGPYLQRSVRYVGKATGEATDLGEGPVPEEAATITVSLRNAAPPGLPDYVTLRPDDPNAPAGQANTWLSVYLGKGATLLAARLDGRPVVLESGVEQGMSVFSAFVTTDRGATTTLVLSVRQPASEGQALRYRQQPLLSPDRLEVDRGGAPLDLVYAR